MEPEWWGCHSRTCCQSGSGTWLLHWLSGRRPTGFKLTVVVVETGWRKSAKPYGTFGLLNAENMVFSWSKWTLSGHHVLSGSLCNSPFSFYWVKFPPVDFNSFKYFVSSNMGSQTFLSQTQSFEVSLRSVWILISEPRRRERSVQRLTTAVICSCPASQQKPLQSEYRPHYHIFRFALPWHSRDSHSSHRTTLVSTCMWGEHSRSAS